MKAPTRNLGDKLQEMSRRSPEGVKALEALVDFFLDELGPEDNVTKPYVWKCDQPKGGRS